MMTKKDFNAIAKILNKANKDAFLKGELNDRILKRISQELSEHFKSVNPNFDEQKFLTACLK